MYYVFVEKSLVSSMVPYFTLTSLTLANLGSY